MKALVVGYGSIGKRHIKNLKLFRNIKIIVCTKRTKDSFLNDNCIVHSSLKQCIDEEPDFAIICNETSHHIDTAIKLANAGINIFIEKPISNSLKNIEKLLQIKNKKKLITHVGSVLRFHPYVKKSKEMLTKNKLGKILSIQIENGSYLPNWHPKENYQKSYAAQEKLGGGVVLTCIHEIDYLFWFYDKIEKVFSYTKKISQLKVSVEDISEILFLLSNNSIAHIHLDFFQRPKSRTFKIIGTKGTLTCDLVENSMEFFNNHSIKTKVFKSKKYDTNVMYIEELRYFINCIKKNVNSFNDINQGVKVLKIALATKKSAKLGKEVKIYEK